MLVSIGLQFKTVMEIGVHFQVLYGIKCVTITISSRYSQPELPEKDIDLLCSSSSCQHSYSHLPSLVCKFGQLVYFTICKCNICSL